MTAPGVTDTRAVPVAAVPPFPPELVPVTPLPPWPPSAVMVTEQIPVGAVAALEETPGEPELDSETGAAPARPGGSSPAATHPSAAESARTRHRPSTPRRSRTVILTGIHPCASVVAARHRVLPLTCTCSKGQLSVPGNRGAPPVEEGRLRGRLANVRAEGAL